MYTTKMYCNAFTDDLNPCLMSCQNDVCILHKDFYNPEVWFERFIFSVDREIYNFSSPAKIQVLYKKSILDGRVKVNREHFRDLLSGTIDPSTFVDYYCLCCRQPGVDPFWNITLFKEAVKTILNLHKPGVYDMVLPNKYIMYRFLDSLFVNSRFDSMAFKLLYYSIMLQDDSSAVNFDGPVSLIQYLKENFKTDILSHSDAEEKLISLVENRTSLNTTVHSKVRNFLKTLSTYRQRFRVYRELECRTMKKELIEIVHQRPELFIDNESYKELLTRWKNLQ